MKCSEIHKKIIFYIENTILEDEVLKIKEHLSNCNECSAIEKYTRGNLLFLNSEKVVNENPFLFNKIQNKLQKEKKSYVFYSFQKIQPLLVAATIVLGLFLGVLIGQQSMNSNKTTVKEELKSEMYFSEFSYQDAELAIFEKENLNNNE